MDALTLRPTTAQLRSLVLTTSVSGVVAVLLIHEHLAGHDASDRILGWGIAASAVMVMMAVVTVAYSRAITECTEAGIRVRGLGLERHWRWDQVSDIAIRIGNRGVTRTVMLTLTGGKQVLLGAPVTGGLMQDRDFDRKVSGIQQFWRRTTGRDSGDARISVLPPTSYRLPARSTLVLLVTLAALGLAAALPVLAREGGPALLVRLGQGQPGYFTGYYDSCSGSCAWVGEFTARQGSAHRGGVTIAPGAGIPPTGGRVAAVDTGRAGPVYPAGGGTGWIPLAATLALLAGCLTVDALWVMSRVRHRRAQDACQPGRAPPTAAVPSGGPARPAVVTGAVFLVVAGTVAAVLFLPLPAPAPPRAAQACADYSEWLAAQGGYSWADQGALARAALTRAARVAPIGALGTDLSTLATDVSAADRFGQSPAGIDALMTVRTDMQAVGHDCFG